MKNLYLFSVTSSSEEDSEDGKSGDEKDEEYHQEQKHDVQDQQKQRQEDEQANEYMALLFTPLSMGERPQKWLSVVAMTLQHNSFVTVS